MTDRGYQMQGARNPVAFFSNGIGDHILALPSLRCLSEIYNRRLTLVTSPQAGCTFFRGVPMRKIIEIEIWRASGELTFDVCALLAQIPQCDLFISLVPWYSTSIQALIAFAQPAASIGLHFDYLDVRIPCNPKRHSMDLTFDVCKLIDPSKTVEQYVGPIIPPDQARAAAFKWIERPIGEKLLVLHPDSKPEKRWKLRHWQEFIGAFLGRNKNFYVAIVGCDDYNLDNIKCANRIRNCNRASLSTALAIVSSADLFVGIDSCMLHAADIANVASVGLFGPTNVNQWGCRVTQNFRHVVSPTTRMCDITVPVVLSAVEDLLFKTENLGLSDCRAMNTVETIVK
jgi:ADP-heptose:LPS heptosyltransferase